MLESSGDRADMSMFGNTNNVINAVQPFDVKAAVAYNAHYLRGFTSEKRDLDIDAILPRAADAVMSIARARAEESTRSYDRGIRWEREQVTLRGTRWVSVYLPVWLYSYYQERSSRPGDGLLHYVAVNGRTGETMGSVPVRQKRLIGVSAAIGAVGTVVGGAAALVLGGLTAMLTESATLWVAGAEPALLAASESDSASNLRWLLGPAAGIGFYAVTFLRYRNVNQRHAYERETASTVTNPTAFDERTGRVTDVENSRISGDNRSSPRTRLGGNSRWVEE